MTQKGIKAIEKVTLIDYPGKIACTIFLFGCNFKCGFCHNPELVLKEESGSLREEDLLDFLKKRVGKLEGVCFTGGEPLMTLEKDFVKKIKELGYSIKIDTNGSNPEKLKEFLDEGLVDFVAMDIKSNKEKYSQTCGVEVNINKIEYSIKLISTLKDYEFRTTIVPGIHELNNVTKMFEWLNSLVEGEGSKFAIQGFKNNGKFIDMEFKNIKDTKEEFLKELEKIAKLYFKEVDVRI